jgi:transcriptional regulator of arginine metabolism
MKPGAAARREALRRLLAERELGSQAEIRRWLARRGHRVTQTTISRDLAALGARKLPTEDGGIRYIADRETGWPNAAGVLPRLLRQFVVDVAPSGNLVVVHTLPGSAGSVAAALDGERLDETIGTVAGDDTVLAVTQGRTASVRLARTLDSLRGGLEPSSRPKGETR